MRKSANRPTRVTAKLPPKRAGATPGPKVQRAATAAATSTGRTITGPSISHGGVSDSAVQSATGKSWREWFGLLDRRHAQRLKHAEIALMLHDELDCPDWWSQMVTVAYEQARGMRGKHQKPSGYEISRSLTIGASAKRLFEAWSDGRLRRRWLPEPVVPRTSTPYKSIRLGWNDGASRLEARFSPKGEDRCQVTVQHGRLPDAQAGERMKTLWGKRLAALKLLAERPETRR